MTLPPLQSATYELSDAFEVNEYYQAKGWTDGLPIMPPTAELVAACLQAAALAPGDVLGVERVRQRPLSEEPFNLHGSSASTGGSAQLIVVHHMVGQGDWQQAAGQPAPLHRN